MSNEQHSLVAETTTSSGTGQSITMDGKATGRQSFADAGYTAGQKVPYSLIQGNSLEVGWGTYQGGADFDRADPPTFSTNGGARINLDGTDATIAVTYLAEYSLFEDDNGIIRKGSDGSQITPSDVQLGNVTNDAQLKISSNLSDLNNTTTARANLGLGNVLNKAQLAKDGSEAATADLPMGGNKITNLQNPASDQDAATKGYVDTNLSNVFEVSVQSFTSSGTWNRPANVRWVKVTVTGGGGDPSNGVGGAGATAIKLLDVTGIASATITVGSAEGDSSWSDGTNTITGGGATSDEGGTATGGDINIPGADGLSVRAPSFWGSAPAYGGGGDAETPSKPAGPGIVLVEEFT